MDNERFVNTHIYLWSKEKKKLVVNIIGNQRKMFL